MNRAHTCARFPTSVSPSFAPSPSTHLDTHDFVGVALVSSTTCLLTLMTSPLPLGGGVRKMDGAFPWLRGWERMMREGEPCAEGGLAVPRAEAKVGLDEEEEGTRMGCTAEVSSSAALGFITSSSSGKDASSEPSSDCDSCDDFSLKSKSISDIVSMISFVLSR